MAIADDLVIEETLEDAVMDEEEEEEDEEDEEEEASVTELPRKTLKHPLMKLRAHARAK